MVNGNDSGDPRYGPSAVQEWYAQSRLLRAKKRAIASGSEAERERAEGWVRLWGQLVRGFQKRFSAEQEPPWSAE